MKGSIHVSRCAVACALALVATTSFADKPDKWVRYVESTGSAWVDTGIIGRPNTKIEAKVEWMNLADSAFVACGYYSNNTRFYMCYCENTAGNMIVSQRTNTKVKLSNGWETRWETGRVYDYTAAFSATNSTGESTATVAVDGISGWSTTFTGLNTGRSLYVFANNSTDGTVGGKSKSRCYGLKIWQGPEDGGDMVLVCDFQPCMKGGRAGLYDAVSGDIFYSISGTNLICDENSEEPDEFIEYVESQGTAAEADGQKPAYIDTGIIGKAGTTVDFKETCLKTISNEFCLLGALGSASNSRFYMWYHANGNTLGLGYANTYWRPSVNNPDATSSQSAADVYKLNYGDTTHALVSFAAGLQTFSTINDDNGTTNLVSRQTIATDLDTKQNLYVFARNEKGTPSAFCASRLYGLKIWQGGALVRDYRPCLKNGVAGLYDDVEKRIFYSLGTPLVYNNVYRQNVKPKEVVFVDYIESDGNNTLDTGVPARTGIRAKGKMAWLHEDENGTGQLRTKDREASRYLENTAAVFWRQQRAYLGAWNVKSGDNGRFHLIHETSSALKAQYGGSGELSAKSGGSNVALYVTTNYTFDVTFAEGSQTMEWNGVQVLDATTAGSVDTGDTLHLFSSSYWRWRSEARCYGLEIYEGDTLVRDFKPCLVDGKGMLYDAVTKSIYRPSPDIPASRTGNIVLSGEEKPACYVDYVETDGQQFIDTGVIGKAATTVEFKETSFESRGDEQCFLGSYGTGDNPRFYLWYHGWGYTAGIGYGVYWRPVTNDVTAIASSSSDPNVYKLPKGTTTHARVSFAAGVQRFSTIDDATGTEKLWSLRDLSPNVDTGRTMYLFAKNDGSALSSQYLAESRFYYLKIWQGNADGSNMHLVRNYKPVRLTNGLVVLWDFANNVPYLPQTKAAPYSYTTFPVVGPDGAEIKVSLFILLR